MFRGVWNYIDGYVIITVEGKYIERFLNLVNADGIRLRDVRSIGSFKISAKINPRDFAALRPAARKYRCKVHIRKKNGLAFLMHRLRARRVLLFGWIAVVIILIIISRHVYFIDVVGTDVVSKAQIIELAEEFGFHTGIAADKVEPNKLAALIMASDSRISWAGAKVEGVRLRIEIREAQEPPEIYDDSTPANIYAAFDGIITEIIATSGRPVVEVGDAVKAGDLLITGDLSTEEKQIFVRANGTVTAQVLHRYIGTAGPTLKKLAPTGNTSNFSKLSIFGFSLLPRIEYDEYKLDTTDTKILSGCFLPLEVRSCLCREYAYSSVKASNAELASIAMYYAHNAMMQNLDKSVIIIDKEQSLDFSKDCSARVTISIITSENIGETVEIPGA